MLMLLIRFLDACLETGVRIGSLSIWLISGIVFIDVTLRFFGAPTLWALEVSTYLMIGAAVMASGKAVADGSHFSVRLLPDALTPLRRRVLDFVIQAAGFGLLCFICMGFFDLLMLSIDLKMRSPTLLQVPLWIPQGVTFAGFVIMALGFVRKVIAVFESPAE